MTSEEICELLVNMVEKNATRNELKRVIEYSKRVIDAERFSRLSGIDDLVEKYSKTEESNDIKASNYVHNGYFHSDSIPDKVYVDLKIFPGIFHSNVLKNTIRSYFYETNHETMSVSKYKELAGYDLSPLNNNIDISKIDTQFGWTREELLNGMATRNTRGGVVLYIPPAHKL